MKHIETPAEILESVNEAKEVISDETVEGGFSEKAEVVKKLLDHISVNVGVINGGTKINVVPESCTVQIDMRLPFGITVADIRSEVNALLKQSELHDVTFSQPSFTNPNYTLPTERIFQALYQNVKTVLGITARPKFATGATDAPPFRIRGIPCISYGPGSMMAAHVQNESVAVQELLDATKVYAGTILDFFFEAKSP